MLNALNLSKTNLIGVYGTAVETLRADPAVERQVQEGEGRRQDRRRHGSKAITQTEVRYQKGGRLISLKMPKG